jgi:hypothetical protein
MKHGYEIKTLEKDTTIYRAAPYIGLQRGNGKATSTNHNFAWFATLEAGAEPYVIIQDHLNSKKMSRIFKYELLQNLSFIDLSNANTLRKLNSDMRYHGYGPMLGSSFIIENGKVKRVSGDNQLSRNKNTANRLRTFLLKHHKNISGWRHGKMERAGGGSQGEEILMFTPPRRVKAPAAQGSAAPSPLGAHQDGSLGPSSRGQKRSRSPSRVPSPISRKPRTLMFR